MADEPKMQQVYVTREFDLGGKTYALGPAEVPADKVESLAKKSLIQKLDSFDTKSEAAPELSASDAAAQMQREEIALTTISTRLGVARDTTDSPLDLLERIAAKLSGDEASGDEGSGQSDVVSDVPPAPNAPASPPISDVLTQTQTDALMAAFGSHDAIRDATEDDLLKVEGVGPATVVKIRAAYDNPPGA